MMSWSTLSTGFTPGRIQHWIRLLIAVVAVAVGLPGRAATFSATLDHDTILLGDSATLSLRFDGGSPDSGLNLPDVSGLQYLNANNPTINKVTMNGQLTLILGIAVKPSQIGEFTIPSMTAKVGSQTLTSDPIKFKVVRAPTATPGSAAEQQSLALLRIILPRKEVFVGETIVIEQQLLIRSGVQNVAGVDVPPLQVPGCTAGKVVQGQQRQTVIGSTSFTVVPFAIPLTVMRAGELSVGPLEGAVVVELPSNRGRDPFDPFGMFNRGVQQRVSVSAPAQTLTAMPLPEAGKPATFTGAVGQFEMAVSAGPTNIAVGDPITIRVQLAGRGSLDGFSLPEQPAWREFKAYPPTVKTETTGDLGLEGTKSFEQVVVPQNTEIRELPPLEFSYFDPEKRGYQTLRQPALALVVRPSGSTPSPTLALTSNATGTPPPAQDIVHIKPRLGRVMASAAPWVERPWFLALQGVPLLGLVGAVLWRRRTDALANNPRLRRQRQVEQLVREGLGQLQQLAADRKSDEFFAAVFRLMQEQIGERLDLPASAITEAVVDEKLRRRGLTAEAAESLHQLFQQCNQARYAPVQSAQALEAVIPKLETALSDLREVRA